MVTRWELSLHLQGAARGSTPCRFAHGVDPAAKMRKLTRDTRKPRPSPGQEAAGGCERAGVPRWQTSASGAARRCDNQAGLAPTPCGEEGHCRDHAKSSERHRVVVPSTFACPAATRTPATRLPNAPPPRTGCRVNEKSCRQGSTEGAGSSSRTDAIRCSASASGTGSMSGSGGSADLTAGDESGRPSPLPALLGSLASSELIRCPSHPRVRTPGF